MQWLKDVREKNQKLQTTIGRDKQKSPYGTTSRNDDAKSSKSDVKSVYSFSKIISPRARVNAKKAMEKRAANADSGGKPLVPKFKKFNNNPIPKVKFRKPVQVAVDPVPEVK